MNENYKYDKKSWIAYRVCSECHEFLTPRQINNGTGVCPECGFDSNLESCATSKIITREIFVYNKKRWWQFWIKKEVGMYFEGKNEFSNNWIDKFIDVKYKKESFES